MGASRSSVWAGKQVAGGKPLLLASAPPAPRISPTLLPPGAYAKTVALQRTNENIQAGR